MKPHLLKLTVVSLALAAAPAMPQNVEYLRATKSRSFEFKDAQGVVMKKTPVNSGMKVTSTLVDNDSTIDNFLVLKGLGNDQATLDAVRSLNPGIDPNMKLKPAQVIYLPTYFENGQASKLPSSLGGLNAGNLASWQIKSTSESLTKVSEQMTPAKVSASLIAPKDLVAKSAVAIDSLERHSAKLKPADLSQISTRAEMVAYLSDTNTRQGTPVLRNAALQQQTGYLQQLSVAAGKADSQPATRNIAGRPVEIHYKVNGAPVKDKRVFAIPAEFVHEPSLYPDDLIARALSATCFPSPTTPARHDVIYGRYFIYVMGSRTPIDGAVRGAIMALKSPQMRQFMTPMEITPDSPATMVLTVAE